MTDKEKIEHSIDFQIMELALDLASTRMDVFGIRKLIKGILEIAKKQSEATNDRT